MKKLINLLFSFTIIGFLTAQSTSTTPCGTDYIQSKAFENADYSRSYFKLQEVFKTKRKVLVNTPKTIPTIVHILHSGEPYGSFPHISSNEVYEVIDTLNAWYTNTNSNLEFCLASVGPEGESINAIQYHNINSIYAGDASGSPYDYNTAVMNATIIAPDEYLNIYVHNWNGNPSGFANVGYGDNCWVKTLRFTDLEGTTLIHETGHWCGLFHTFTKSINQGSYSNCEDALNESNCELQGDKVCDTPATPVDFSCSDACDEIDEVDESWMSYAPDNCQYLFTPGQINRMHSQLESYRQGVINNNACGEADIDLAIISIENQNPQCDTYFNPLVTVANFGLNGTFGVEATLQIIDSLGELTHSDIFTGALTLDANESIGIYFSPITLQYGDYNLIVNVETLNDGWEFNNTLEQELPFQPFVELTIELSMNNFPTVQWKLQEWDPETQTTSPSSIHSCNWGGIDCWDDFVQNPSEYWPIELNYCLQPGCYDLFWRYTGNVNMTNCILFTGQECYNTAYLSNGETLFYDEGSQEGGNYHYYFCVEAPLDCPITECPTDLDGDGATTNSDLMVFLSMAGQTGECLEGDLNFDGSVGIQDLTLFLNNFGYDCYGNQLDLDGFDEATSIDFYLNLDNAQIVKSEVYDLSGRRVNDKGVLPEGIYIIKQYWNKYGFVTTKKLYISQ